MNGNLESEIRQICQRYGNDRTRMMDIVCAVQARFGQVSGQAMDLIARAVGTHRVEVASVVSFYSFLSDRPQGQVVIRLCNDIIDLMQGADRVARVFEEELGIRVGQTTPDGRISLEYTPCIGMCDQAPAALINDVVVTELHRSTAREIVQELRQHMDPRRLVHRLGDGNNAHELVRAMVRNNLRNDGPIVFSPLNRGEALSKALAMSPAEAVSYTHLTLPTIYSV